MSGFAVGMMYIHNHALHVMLQDDDLIGSIPLGDNDLQIRVVTDPKAPPVRHSPVCVYTLIK